MGLLKTNCAIGALEGAVGDLVFVKHKPGVKIVRRRPTRKGSRTPAQEANQERFSRAMAYAKAALDNPETRAVYEAAARLVHRRAINLAQVDYLRPPFIGGINPWAFTGEVGGIIRIEANDDFELVSLTIRVRDLAGVVLDDGRAVLDGQGSSSWLYQTTSEIAPGQTVIIEATGKDRPGNTVVKQAHFALVAAA